MRLFGILAVCGALALCKGAAASVPEGALPPASAELLRLMDGAREHSPDLARRLAQLDEALAGEAAARAPSLPRVQASAQLGGQAEEREIDGSRSFFTAFYNATASQPIYHWGALERARERAALYTEVARNDAAEARRIGQLDVLRGWLALATAEATVAVSRMRADLARADLAFEAERVRTGESSAVQLRGFEEGARAAALALADAEGARAATRRSLAALAGTVPERAPDLPAIQRTDSLVAWADTAALANVRPVSLLNLETLIAAERLQQEIEGVRTRPRLGVSVNASRENRNADNDPLGRRQFVHSVGAYATVDWLLFDGHAARAAKAQSRARQRQYEAELRQAEAARRAGLEASALSVRLAAGRVELLERRLAEALEGEKLRREENQLGLVSDRQLSDAVLTVADARQAALIGRAEFHLACASLILGAGGTLYPESIGGTEAAPHTHE